MHGVETVSQTQRISSPHAHVRSIPSAGQNRQGRCTHRGGTPTACPLTVLAGAYNGFGRAGIHAAAPGGSFAMTCTWRASCILYFSQDSLPLNFAGWALPTSFAAPPMGTMPTLRHRKACPKQIYNTINVTIPICNMRLFAKLICIHRHINHLQHHPSSTQIEKV